MSDRSLTRVISWYRMTRLEYHFNKGAHAALITMVLVAFGVSIWRAFGVALALYWLAPKAYYLVSWFVWRPTAALSLRPFRNVFRTPYAPDPVDWLVDLICCALIGPALVVHQYGVEVGLAAFTLWLLGYLVLYPWASP